MKISEIIRGAGVKPEQPSALDIECAGVCCDTRTIQKGELFFAVSPAFAAQAVQKGAAAVVAEEGVTLPDIPEGTPVLRTSDIRRALALSAASFFGRPGSSLTVLGITGTNGKTTTSLLASSMLRAAGESVGVIGTIGYTYAGRTLPAPNTTPGSIPLQKLLADMQKSGVTSAVMEVSSHALDQKRADGIPFACAAFTNLTRDHLDYHGDIETYFAAKTRLFTELCAGTCIINGDDPHGQRLLAHLIREGRVAQSFSVRSSAADIFATDVVQTIGGISAVLHTPEGEAHFHSPLVGLHNLENILAAAGLVLGAGFELSDVVRGIELTDRIPGRLDRVPSAASRAVFVDYAHTDDALTHALSALRPLTRGRLICVFGCGGDRDQGKRPLMGRAVAKGADIAIVTNDNPRSEDPEVIARAVLEGVREGGMALVQPDALSAKSCAAILPRADAIRRAVSLMEDGDVLLIAGKGHENYQLIGGESFHFDDREEAAAALDEAGFGGNR